MKKILLTVAALSMFAACSEVTDSQKMQQQPDGIVFGAYSARPTKADIAVVGTLQADGFDVMGIYRDQIYLDNTVSYEGATSNRFKQDGTSIKYWPSDLATNKISFYAVNDEDLTYASPAVSFAFETATKSEDQKDVVVASALNVSRIPEEADPNFANTGYKAGCQPLTFTHALTKINFSFEGADKTSGLTYTVTAIKVKALSEGTYTFGSSWALGTTEETFEYFIKTGGESVTNEEICPLYSNMMLIPQGGLTTLLDCEITYSVTDGVAPLFEGTKEFKIPTYVGEQAWDEQKSFRYSLTLPVGTLPITFSASVTGWEDELGGVVII